MSFYFYRRQKPDSFQAAHLLPQCSSQRNTDFSVPLSPLAIIVAVVPSDHQENEFGHILHVVCDDFNYFSSIGD